MSRSNITSIYLIQILIVSQKHGLLLMGGSKCQTDGIAIDFTCCLLVPRNYPIDSLSHVGFKKYPLTLNIIVSSYFNVYIIERSQSCLWQNFNNMDFDSSCYCKRCSAAAVNKRSQNVPAPWGPPTTTLFVFVGGGGGPKLHKEGENIARVHANDLMRAAF